MTRFVNADRNQTFLLPPDMRDWVPDDDPCHFVITAVERVDMSARYDRADYKSENKQYHPKKSALHRSFRCTLEKTRNPLGFLSGLVFLFSS